MSISTFEVILNNILLNCHLIPLDVSIYLLCLLSLKESKVCQLLIVVQVISMTCQIIHVRFMTIENKNR